MTPSTDLPAGVARARVALVVDHPDRDLAGLVLTALELARRRVTCHLVPHNLQEREIWALAPDFVLFNYLRRSNESFARELHDAGIAFGVLDTEGAVWTDPEEYASLFWRDVALLRQARCVCMWGPRLADYLVERRLFAAHQITVTGCPRFDLYYAPWRQLQADVNLVRPRRPTILLNTNFSLSSPRFTTADKSYALHRSVLGYDEAVLRQVVQDEQRAIRAMSELADALARAYPAADVVIRPHPFEDPTPYEAVQQRNVRVDHDASIQAAILGASAVIQRSCTTAIEAAMAGVPAFSPQWIPAPFLIPPAEAASIPCESLTELQDHLDAAIDGRFVASASLRAQSTAVIHECVHVADGLAHRRVADAVIRSLPSDTNRVAEPVDSHRCRRRLYGLDSPAGSLLTHAARHVRHGLGLSPQWSFKRLSVLPATEWAASRKYFGADAVQRLVARAVKLADGASGEVHATAAPQWRPDRGRRTQAVHSVTIDADAHAVPRHVVSAVGPPPGHATS